MKNSELQLADQVIYEDDSTNFGINTVKQIKDGIITFFRPYTHTSDFSSTAGVICYVGVEEWKTEVNDDRANWKLVDRKSIR